MICKGCRGCIIYETTGGPTSCDVANANRQMECPCLECVVKMICRETCEDLWTLVEDIEGKSRR